MSPSPGPFLRAQARPAGQVHTTGPGSAPVFSPTATNPLPVPARPSTVSPATGGRPGAGRQILPSGEVQAACWPSASQVPPLRAIRTGAVPAPGPPATAGTAGAGPVVRPGPAGPPGGATAPVPPSPPAPAPARAARDQVWPPSAEKRNSGSGPGWLGSVPMATTVLPAAAIPVSDACSVVVPAAGPASAASAAVTGGIGLTRVN